MSALTEVVSLALAHENSCDEGVVDLIDSVKTLLTREDIDWFTRMCDRGVHVSCGECDLYELYDEHLVDGETQFVQVSIGMMTDEQHREDEAIGWGDYGSEMGRTYFCLFRCWRMSPI
jgi:hypothetical protein